MLHLKTQIFLLLFFLADAMVVHAQMCNGSLGDPVVNVTFGIAHKELGNGNTDFSYVRACPKKGEYTIQNLIFGCGDHDWYMLAGDHTGDENGQYMLVNSESTSGIVYRDTARGLCANTTYQFSAWIANVMQDFACSGDPVLPNITMKVSTLSGQVLDSLVTGDLQIETQRTWIQFAFLVTAPPGNDQLVLSLETNPPFGCGGGFVLDDIMFTMCGPKVRALLDGQMQDGNVCADYTDPFILTAQYDNGLAQPAFQWQQSLDSGKTFSDIIGETALTYKIPRRSTGAIVYRIAMGEKSNIASATCRLVSNEIYTEIHPVPPHQSPQTFIGCKDKDLALPKIDPSALSLKWQGPNGFTSSDPNIVIPSIQFADTGLYVRTQLFYFGCTTVDSFTLSVYPSTTLETPTFFELCEDEVTQINAVGTGSFQWTPPDGLSDPTIPNPVLTPKDTTIYKALVTNIYGCKDSAFVTVYVSKKPVAYAGPDLEILQGDSIQLQGSVSGTDVSFAWTPSNFILDADSVSPIVYPSATAQYTLTASSNVGCGTSTSTVEVKVFSGIDMPNAFTPNGDGINDIFRVIAPGTYVVKTFRIFDRWGNLLFSPGDVHEGWDGTFKGEPQPAGAYLYIITLEGPSSRIYNRKGSFYLIR